MTCILITGGTGSFGSAFVRHALEQDCFSRICILSRDELKQFELSEQLSTHRNANRLRFVLGDVRSPDRMNIAFSGVDIVIHAAALKQVPALEENPDEGVATNIIGTQNVLRAAWKRDVRRVVLVSTDKACEPSNFYGATKACAERLTLAYNRYSAGSLLCQVVRYGNVWGSRGSVYPVFLRKKAEGKPLTITHPEMTRFVLTINQAVAFVWNVLQHGHAPATYVPDLQAMRIIDLARAMGGGQEPEIIGIRPGEKLHETLISAHEAPLAHLHPFGVYQIGALPADAANLNHAVASNNADLLTLEEIEALCASHCLATRGF